MEKDDGQKYWELCNFFGRKIREEVDSSIIILTHANIGNVVWGFNRDNIGGIETKIRHKNEWYQL